MNGICKIVMITKYGPNAKPHRFNAMIHAAVQTASHYVMVDSGLTNVWNLRKDYKLNE
jgi:hypothetical protein